MYWKIYILLYELQWKKAQNRVVITRKVIMQKSIFSSVSAPLISIFILMNGFALFSTYIPLKLKFSGAPSWSVGLITAAYYTGLVIGSFKNASFILRVGHIRAFAAFASVTTCLFLLNSLTDSTYVWIFLRAVSGYCLSGLYIVIESWILNASNIESRGKYLSMYMIAIYGSSATGQLLLNVVDMNTLSPFIIVAILSSFAIFPLAITRIGNPKIEEPSALSVWELLKLSPSGAVACCCAGLVFGATAGFIPIFFQKYFSSIQETAFAMFVFISGGVVLQYPIGRLSDYIDRRKVILFLCALLCVTSLISMHITLEYKLLFYFTMFVCGGVVHTLYPVSISHTCDALSHNDIVAATQGLMLIYGVGAVLGPIVGGVFTTSLGPNGLFVYLLIISIALGCYLLLRMQVKSAPSVEEHAAFVPMPTTTPVASELDPRSIEDE